MTTTATFAEPESPDRRKSPVRIAVVQFDPQVGLENLESNRTAVRERLDRAVGANANLIVLPELATTGYSFGSREEAFSHAEPVPGGRTVGDWAAYAAEHGVYIVGCLPEVEGLRLFDTAVLVGPDGHVGKYRKTHLWNEEKLFFTPGDLGFPVFDTRIGSERGSSFMGNSLIAGTNGWPIGRIAGPAEDTILYADVDLVDARSAPIWNRLNDLHRDRRTDLYDQLLGFKGSVALPR
jgi:predicted amidohydrolase